MIDLRNRPICVTLVPRSGLSKSSSLRRQSGSGVLDMFEGEDDYKRMDMAYTTRSGGLG